MEPTDSHNNAARRRILPFSFPVIFMMVGVSVIAGLASGLSNPINAKRTTRSAATFDQSDAANLMRQPARNPAAPSGPDPFASYKTVVGALQEKYYGQSIDADRTRTLTFEAVKGVLGCLNDQFSSYLDAAQWQQLVTMTEGRFGGVGAMMEQSAGGIEINRPLCEWTRGESRADRRRRPYFNRRAFGKRARA